jgi:hypothetical protein
MTARVVSGCVVWVGRALSDVVCAAGCRWSTTVPNFNPLDLINNLRRRLSGLEPLSMSPWYNGFEGSIAEVRAA